MSEYGIFDFQVFAIKSQGLYVYPMDFMSGAIYDALTLQKVNNPSPDCADYMAIEGIVRAVEDKMPVICKRVDEAPKVIYCDREKNYYDHTGRCLNCYQDGDELIKIKIPACTDIRSSVEIFPEEKITCSFDLDSCEENIIAHLHLPGSPMVQACVREKAHEAPEEDAREKAHEAPEEELRENVAHSAPEDEDTHQNHHEGSMLMNLGNVTSSALQEGNMEASTLNHDHDFTELFKTMERRIVELEHTVEEQRAQINHMKGKDLTTEFEHMKFIVETFLSRSYKIYPIPLAPSNFFEQLPGEFVELHQYYEWKKDGTIIAEKMEPLMQPLVASAREESNNRCISFKTKDGKRYYIRTAVYNDKYFPVMVYNSEQYAKMKEAELVKDSLECESLNELLTPQELSSGKKYHFITPNKANPGYVCM